MSGLIADAKTLIDKARVETQVWPSLIIKKSLHIYFFFFLLHLFLVFELCSFLFLKNHWFTYNETMTVESVTQAVSNLALQFGEEDADPGAMVSPLHPMWRSQSTHQSMP